MVLHTATTRKHGQSTGESYCLLLFNNSDELSHIILQCCSGLLQLVGQSIQLSTVRSRSPLQMQKARLNVADSYDGMVHLTRDINKLVTSLLGLHARSQR